MTFHDKRGDRWTVRECDDDDHCVVVEREILVLGEFIDDPEPLHVPLESLGDLIESLRTFDKEAK